MLLNTSLEYILVRTFPECAMVLIIGCYFLNLKVPMAVLLKKTLVLGIIQSCIRTLPISFGIHTIIGMAIVLLVLVNMSKDTFINCIMALCKIFLCLILSEFIYIKILTSLFLIPQSILVDNTNIMSAIYTLPSLIILGILAFAVEFITRKIQGRSITNHNE